MSATEDLAVDTPAATDAPEGRVITKRRRVAKACTSCRAKKSRCDGSWPRCSTCVALDYECAYESLKKPGPMNVVVTRDYLTNLEARMVTLEDLVKGSLKVMDAFSAGNALPLLTAASLAAPSMSEEHVVGAPTPQSVTTIATSSPEGAPSPSWKNFSNSTAGDSFHSLVLKTFFQPQRSAAGPTSGPPPVRQQLADTNPLRLGLIDISDLPTEEEAQLLFNHYFSHTQLLHPLVHEKSLRESYSSFLRNPDTPTGTWKGTSILTQTALYFAIFAMGLRVGGRGKMTAKEKNFADKAKLLLEHRSPLPQDFRHGKSYRKVIAVQVLLLRALYVQNNEEPGECWNLAGWAVRTAYGMGLHRDALHPADDPLEREQRKRTWWGCVAVDGLMTLTLDRPSAVSTSISGFPLPAALPDESPQLAETFRCSIGLYQVLLDVPSNLNNNVSTFAFLHEHQSAATPSASSLISKLEERWNAWEISVPTHLQISPTCEWVNGEALVLGLRALSIRLLIHRPFLHNAINGESGSESLDFQRATGRSLAIIVETSMRVIYVLVASEGPDVLSAPWYRLFVALNSFMSLAAVSTLDSSLWSSYTSSDTSKTAINDAMQAVRGLIATLAADGVTSAVRSLPIVDQILNAPMLSRMGSPAPDPLGAAPGPELEFDTLPYIDWEQLFQGVDTGSIFSFLGPEMDTRDMTTPLEVTAWAGAL